MFYVFAQFFLLAVIAWPLSEYHLSPVGIALIALAGGISIWTLLTNRPGNFNVRPIPKESGKLITHGPYKYIRHPMYSSLFFGGLGVVLCLFVWWKLLAWALLIIALAFKARFEEKALLKHYADYAQYKKTNSAFIPWIW